MNLSTTTNQKIQNDYQRQVLQDTCSKIKNNSLGFIVAIAACNLAEKDFGGALAGICQMNNIRIILQSDLSVQYKVLFSTFHASSFALMAKHQNLI